MMGIELVLIVAGVMLLVLGLLGCVLPIIPGPPLSFIGLLIQQFRSSPPFSTELLVVLGVLTVAVTILDYIVPVWGTKKFGGTKYGVWGSTIGLVLGLFCFPPLGIIIGPFLGAVVGELIAGQEMGRALKAGLGSFIGFLAGTIMKLAISIAMIVFFVKSFF